MLQCQMVNSRESSADDTLRLEGWGRGWWALWWALWWAWWRTEGVAPPLLTTGEMEGDLVARGDSDGVREGVMAADVRPDS